MSSLYDWPKHAFQCDMLVLITGRVSAVPYRLWGYSASVTKTRFPLHAFLVTTISALTRESHVAGMPLGQNNNEHPCQQGPGLKMYITLDKSMQVPQWSLGQYIQIVEL